MHKWLAPSLALIANLGAVGVAEAQMVSAGTPSTVAQALQSAGYRAEMTRDGGGDPMIKSTSSGSNFAIFFFGCTQNINCRSLQFYAGYSDPKNSSLGVLNTWNATHRFGRAYQTDQGSARVEMDIYLGGEGISRALFVNNLETWVGTMSAFEALVYNR